jgi:hypothetical protein
MYEIVFSLVPPKVLLASAVGFLALTPLLVIYSKSFDRDVDSLFVFFSLPPYGSRYNHTVVEQREPNESRL